MFTSLADMIGEIETFVGSSVAISGQLLIGEGDVAFLARDFTSYKHGERLLLSDGKRIARHLLLSLPAYGGGGIIYDEHAFLAGTVACRSGGFELRNITYCKVVRDEYEIQIPLE